jgi:hypothetical protein
MTKKTTTTKKLKHDINNKCDSARNQGGSLPDQQQSCGLSDEDTPTWDSTDTWCRISDGGSIPSYCTEGRIKELERHSAMLGRISIYVAEYCDEDDTTLTGVMKIIARLKEYETNEIWESYYEEKKSK